MRRFTSYGPVNPKKHFCVDRSQLVEECVEQLVGDEDEGHFFTIWGPRQTGKTGLMRRAIEEIKLRYGDQFIVGNFSMQGVAMRKSEPPEGFLDRVPDLMARGFQRAVERPTSWEQWAQLFRTNRNVFDRKVILLIDEVDKLPRDVIDLLVGLFRDMYLDRCNFLLHGLALVGVRAVLGVDRDSGSPFNVQRSLRVKNLADLEVRELFDQYQEECGQVVAPEVVEKVYESVLGQPGLTCWLGELLTQKYNSAARAGAGRPRLASLPIGMTQWRHVYARALHTERNNNILNLEAKARSPFADEVLELFARSNVAFSVGQPWCDYLELNGIIREKGIEDKAGNLSFVCQFASPFVQRRLFNTFAQDLCGDRSPVLALEPGDLLEDVFAPKNINLPALLERYKSYLVRLNSRGIDPWKGHPRRKTDLNLPEAIAHFHLYAWLREAIGLRAVITPEFPTGNGKVDLVVRDEERLGLIEVKSFRDSYELRRSYEKTADYARKSGVETVTMAVFMPVRDDKVLEQVSGVVEEGDVRIVVVAIGWG